MKSLFADFLQNVTPPGAFKRGYTVSHAIVEQGKLKIQHHVVISSMQNRKSFHCYIYLNF